MKEIAKMVNFNHPNVMTLTGVILIEGAAPLLVMPYMAKGTLLTHVQKNKAQFMFEDKEQSDKVLYCVLLTTECTYNNVYTYYRRELPPKPCVSFLVKLRLEWST